MEPDGEVRTLRTIGEEIRAWYKHHGLKQMDLAAALKVSLTTIQRIEKGEKALNLDEIGRLSYLMGKPYEFFVPTFELNEDNGFDRLLRNLKKQSSIKSKQECSSEQKGNNNSKEMERRLLAAVRKILKTRDKDREELLIQQVEITAQLAGKENENR